MKKIFRVLTSLLVVSFILGCGSSDRDSYAPVDPRFNLPVERAVIDSWIEADDQPAIRAHAWKLWEAINQPSGRYVNGAQVPVWETWYSTRDVYGESSICGAYNRPQLRNLEDSAQIPQHVISDGLATFTRFNKEYVDHVCALGYHDPEVLTGLNASFDHNGAPVETRSIVPFPDETIAIKPVFMLIKSDGVTALPYWSGEKNSTNPRNPSVNTWTNCVAVNVDEEFKESEVLLSCHGKEILQRVVPLSDFYSIKLTEDDARRFNDDTKIEGAEAGDYVVLVAMHVSSREIDNWTWQTYWWTPERETVVYPAEENAPDSFSAPWKHFAMCTSFVMTAPANNPAGEPVICYNPYLEPGLPDVVGIRSNCMTCHAMATWKDGGLFGGGLDYRDNGFISFSDPEFKDVTRLDFMWSITQAAE